MIWRYGPVFLSFVSSLAVEFWLSCRREIALWLKYSELHSSYWDKITAWIVTSVSGRVWPWLCARYVWNTAARPLWLDYYKGDQSQRSHANYVLLICATLLKSWNLTVHHLYQRACNLGAKGTKGEVRWVFWEWGFYFLKQGPLKWLLNPTRLTLLPRKLLLQSHRSACFRRSLGWQCDIKYLMALEKHIRDPYNFIFSASRRVLLYLWWRRFFV